MGMTGSEMVDLWLLVSGQKDASRPLALKLINLAQNKIMTRVHRQYTAELDTVDSSVTLDTDGKFDMSAMSTRMWEDQNGIDFIRPTDSNIIAYRKISFFEYRKLVELGISDAMDPLAPKYYIRGTYLYALPAENGQILDVYYRAAPTAITDSTTAAGFTERIQDIIVRLACMGINNDMYASALEDIRELNSTVPVTESNRFPDPLLSGGYGERDMFSQAGLIGDLEVIQGVTEGNDGDVWQGNA
jgi:hypothetical protein